MDEARQAVRTIEVTRAVRSTTLNGVQVSEGDVIAIVDDQLRLAAATTNEAVEQALAGLDTRGASLITLYHGGETAPSQAEQLASNLRQQFAGCEVEVVAGGQPHYDYIVSIE